MNCFIYAAYIFSFHYVVISIVVYCTDEAMKTETPIQFRVQRLKFRSAHKDEGNPQITFFFHLL